MEIKPIKDETLALNPSFIGSPTVIINGKDVEKCYNNTLGSKDKMTDEVVDGLACRLYNCRISRKCPSEEMVVCALNS